MTRRPPSPSIFLREVCGPSLSGTYGYDYRWWAKPLRRVLEWRWNRG